MSFRLFIYYCALCGGWAAFFGWMFGRIASFQSDSFVINCIKMGIKGMLLGFFIALGLGLVDALWNLSLKQIPQIGMRVGAAVIVGALGGLLGGLIGQAVYGLPFLQGSNIILEMIRWLGFIFGWTLTGFLIGMSIGFFEMVMSIMTNKDVSGSQKKMIKAVVGGTAGGILGGILSLMLQAAWGSIFSGKNVGQLWSPTAMGFVALGMCIGLLIGLAQVIMKEAWIKVEAGFRPGREKIITKEQTTIGRAEACDIGLFGDPGTEKMHARIIMMGSRYFLEDVGTPGGTFLNEQRISGRTPLSNGDRIRVGKNVLLFQERQKRTSDQPQVPQSQNIQPQLIR